MLGLRRFGSAALCILSDSLEVRRSPPARKSYVSAGGSQTPAWIYGHPECSSGVLLFHSAFGLTAHEHALAGRLAREGFACMAVRYSARTTGRVLEDDGERARIERVAEESARRLSAEGRERPIAVLGLSLGGYLALHVASELTSLIAGAVVYSGCYERNVSRAAGISAPLLILQGGRDFPEFVGAAHAVRQSMLEAGRSCELSIYRDAVHQFDLVQSRNESSRDAWERTVRFFDRTLCGMAT